MTASTNYERLEKQLVALLDGETDALAASANFVGLLNAEIPDINWLGLYVLRDAELVLGPFQGLPACVHIPVGLGVCGTAAARKTTLRVANVHDFDGHITCDPASAAELVVPLLAGDRLLGVLDIDSPHENRFSAADQDGVEKLCRRFVALLPATSRDSRAFI